MGTYTTVITRLTLKSDTPAEIVTMLNLLVSDDSDDWKNIIEFRERAIPAGAHDFFTNDHWYCIFGNFTGDDECKSNWIPPRTVDAVSSIKNYDGLVDQFYNWIRPYIDTSEPHLISTIGEDHELTGKRPMRTIVSSTGSPKVKGNPYEIVDDLPKDTSIADAANLRFEPSTKHVKYAFNARARHEDELCRSKALAVIENAKERASKAAAKKRRKTAKASQRRNRK